MQGQIPAAPYGALPHKKNRKNEQVHFYGFFIVRLFIFDFFVF